MSGLYDRRDEFAALGKEPDFFDRLRAAGVSVRAMNALDNSAVWSVAALRLVTPGALLRTKNVGRKYAAEILAAQESITADTGPWPLSAALAVLDEFGPHSVSIGHAGDISLVAIMCEPGATPWGLVDFGGSRSIDSACSLYRWNPDGDDIWLAECTSPAALRAALQALREESGNG